MSWQDYESPITLNTDGEHKIIYTSTDRAGNREAEKEAVIKIDRTKPEILILIPAEIRHNEILNIEYVADDNFSGLATDTVRIYFDGSLSSTTVDLFYESIGEHEIKITTEDRAGNMAEEVITFNIITSIDGTIADINRSYEENLINEKAKDKLIKDLEAIKKFQEKFGRFETKKDERRAEIMTRCLEKKDVEWCEEKLGKLFEKTDYIFDRISRGILTLKLKLVLAELEVYRKKNWVSEVGYGIIKEDLKYLINNLN